MIKDQIADAFQRHFHQFGFKKTSVDEVAQELQISKKTIYQHFSSKEEIFQYVIQRNSEALLEEILAKIPQDVDEGKKLELLIRMIHRLAREFQQANLSHELSPSREIAEIAYRQSYSKLIAELITAGVENGAFQSSDLLTATHYINLIVSESIRWMVEHPELPVEDETIRTVKKILQ